MYATARRKFKKIDKLINEDKVEVKEQAGLCEVETEYFSQLFEEKEGVYEHVLSLIQQRVSSEDNDKLLEPITKEELYETQIHMHLSKSPGPNGFNLAYYRNF